MLEAQIYDEFVSFCEAKGLSPISAKTLAEAWRLRKAVEDSLQTLPEEMVAPRKLFEDPSNAKKD